MKFKIFNILLTLLLILLAHYSQSQDITGGTVTYQATTRYDFQTLFAPWADDHREWVDSIPTESRGNVTLTFTEQNALYDSRADEQILPRQLRDAQAKAVDMLEPAAELQKVFLDLDKNGIIRQLDFMGRLFLVSDEIETKSWKLTNKMTKILDYICMGAELEQDGKSIFAYFTSEIPLPIGPDEYFGLPGLILAVEEDGATVFLATSIELSPPGPNAVAKPKEGKELTQKEFDIIVTEKIKEYRETIYDNKYK